MVGPYRCVVKRTTGIGPTRGLKRLNSRTTRCCSNRSPSMRPPTPWGSASATAPAWCSGRSRISRRGSLRCRSVARALGRTAPHPASSEYRYRRVRHRRPLCHRAVVITPQRDESDLAIRCRAHPHRVAHCPVGHRAEAARRNPELRRTAPVGPRKAQPGGGLLRSRLRQRPASGLDAGNTITRLITARWLAANPFAMPDPELRGITKHAYGEQLPLLSIRPDVAALYEAVRLATDPLL